MPKEKLLLALERVLVDITNKVGVDVNRAATDAYYQHLLPFVCGLGPRKAQVVVKKINAMVGLSVPTLYTILTYFRFRGVILLTATSSSGVGS